MDICSGPCCACMTVLVTWVMHAPISGGCIWALLDGCCQLSQHIWHLASVRCWASLGLTPMPTNNANETTIKSQNPAAISHTAQARNHHDRQRRPFHTAPHPTPNTPTHILNTHMHARAVLPYECVWVFRDKGASVHHHELKVDLLKGLEQREQGLGEGGSGTMGVHVERGRVSVCVCVCLCHEMQRQAIFKWFA